MGCGVVMFGSGGALHLSRRCCRIVSGIDGGGRWQVLEQVDKELTKGNDRAALSLVRDLQAQPGGLRCFGAARQVHVHDDTVNSENDNFNKLMMIFFVYPLWRRKTLQLIM